MGGFDQICCPASPKLLLGLDLGLGCYSKLIQNTKCHLRPLFELRGLSNGKVNGFVRLDLIWLSKLEKRTFETHYILGYGSAFLEYVLTLSHFC